MKKTNKFLLLLATAFTAIGVTSAAVLTNNEHMNAANAAATVVSDAEIKAYYSGISDSLTGNALKTALNSLNNSKRKRQVGYADFRQFAAKCDKDPNGTQIVGFYNNKLVGTSWSSGLWNREHVWPDSHGGNLVENDAHMVRAAEIKSNGDRGNEFFAKTKYDPGQYIANYRGIAARIVFYSAIADLKLTIADIDYHYSTKANRDNMMGKLSDLLEWNLQYLPSNDANAPLELRIEQNRNNVIQKDSNGQGNRNPFIDHPEYACKIWGDTNATTKAICKNNVSGGGGNGGNTDGDEGQTGGCQGSIVGASSVALSVSALAGFLFFNKKRKETEEEK